MGLIEDFDEPGGRMWVLGYPMHGATFLVLLHCAAMVACALLVASGRSDALGFFLFARPSVLSGHVWRLFTYAFVNLPSLFFAIDMAMLYWLVMGLESAIGRRRSFTLYASLVLLQSLFYLLLPYGFPGLGSVIFGLFIAYATVYPDAQIFFGIPIKYLAYAALGIYALQDLTYHAWTGLAFLALNSGFAYAGMRLLGFQGGFDWWDRWSAAWERRREEPRKEDVQESIDPILDKIAACGINSLTEAERKTLEQARSRLNQGRSEPSP